MTSYVSMTKADLIEALDKRDEELRTALTTVRLQEKAENKRLAELEAERDNAVSDAEHYLQQRGVLIGFIEAGRQDCKVER